MKKKVLAIISAAMMFMMSTMPVLASTSPVTSTTNGQICDVTLTSKSAADYAGSTSLLTEGFSVGLVSEDLAIEAEKEVIKTVLNDVSAFATNLGNNDLKAAATDKTKKVDAEVLTVVDINNTTATKTNGFYEFEVKVDGVKSGDIVLTLHRPDGETAWKSETCVAYDGKVKVYSRECSPFCITKVTITTKSNNNNNSTTPTSPKTGEAVPTALLISLAGLIGTAVCLRKVFGK